ncbi:hypothetical protein RHSIM_Rhsim04G0143700 [Rhododendron simsii]|uniref:Uncharacterized protein n=1 Tax=Rhododendron simsii TaxID=118357 RepID=A0A834H0D2_RHOSS|nr:hypothetical protein RHSIM_Rhsim04G0143700 [Rhododendron simsii]
MCCTCPGSLKSLSSAYELVRQTHLQNLVLPSAAVSDSMETNSYAKRFFVDLPKELFEMLSCAGPYLYCDTLLLQKEARVRIEEALGTCLLPSLQLTPANPAVGQEIWDVMNLLPRVIAFMVSGKKMMSIFQWFWLQGKLQSIGCFARLFQQLDSRRILKRLVKENLKQLGRMVAKLAHANPMTVLRTIVHQGTMMVPTLVS